MIQITVDTRRAVVTNKELLTVGSAGIQVGFTLSEDWDALSKLAVFRVGDEGTKVDVALGIDLSCVVPPEVLTVEGEPLFIGIYGANESGSVIIPTIWASAGVVKPGTEPNTPATAEPTPVIWAQILSVAEDAEQTAAAAMSNVEAGLQELSGLENTVQNAEDQRQANELVRIANETERVAAETERSSAENSREVSETERLGNETTRQNNETARATAETARASAETSRASAEVSRVNAETGRAAAETVRGNNESQRQQNEAARQAQFNQLKQNAIPYVLEPSVSAIVYNPDAPAGQRISPTALSVDAYRIDIDGDRGGYTADVFWYVCIDGEGIPVAAETKYSTTGIYVTLPQTITDEATVEFYIQKNPEIGLPDTLARITVPIIKSGTKGDPGTTDAGEIEFDETETYAAGTVGAALSAQKNAIDQKEAKTTYTTLSGTTVTQIGEDHVMYLCGELATLSFTAPVSGITAIRFTSGTTATVVTLTGITMPDDWEGAEANKTYEINVLDGKGVYASWS